MAFVNEVGASVLQTNMDYVVAAAFGVTGIMDATAEKLAMVGKVWHPTLKTGTINIRKVHFRCGAIASLGASSEVRVSLQNVSATAGVPYQPDGTQDQFYDFKTATTTLTANAWNTTGALSADRAVDLSADSLGDANSAHVAVVWEFQVFSASDSVIVSNYNYAGERGVGLGGTPLLNTGTWALLGSRLNNIVLECDDGTFAFLGPCAVFSAISTASVSSTGAIRRIGVKFKVPTTRKVDRAALAFTVPNGCDGRLVLYDSDGTTELASVDIDNDAVATVSMQYHEVQFPPVTLSANTFYRFAFVGGTATAAVVQNFDVNAAGHMDGLFLGQGALWTQHDGASWTDTATRAPFFGLGFSAYDDGAGGGGGGLAANPMRGFIG